jgi:hypothetical protein
MIPEFLRFGFGEANVPELETALRVFRKHGIQMMLGVHAVSPDAATVFKHRSDMR